MIIIVTKNTLFFIKSIFNVLAKLLFAFSSKINESSISIPRMLVRLKVKKFALEYGLKLCSLFKKKEVVLKKREILIVNS